MGSFRHNHKSKKKSSNDGGEEFHIVCTNELAACHGYNNSEQFFNAICRGAEKVGRLVSRTPPHMAEIVVMVNRGAEGLEQLLRRQLHAANPSSQPLQHDQYSSATIQSHSIILASLAKSSSTSSMLDSSRFTIGDVIVRDDRLDNPIFEFGKWKHHEEKKRAQVTGTLLGNILGVFENDPRRQQRKYQYVIACAPLLSNELHRWKAEAGGAANTRHSRNTFLSLNPMLGVSGGSGGGGGTTNAHHARSPLARNKPAFIKPSQSPQQQHLAVANTFELNGGDLDVGCVGSDVEDEDDPTLLVNLLRSDRTAPIPLPPQLQIAPPKAYTNATLANTVVDNMKKQRAATTMDLQEDEMDKEEDALRAAGIAPPPVKTVTQQLFGVLSSIGVCGKEINHPNFNPDDRVNRSNFDSGLGRGVEHDSTTSATSSSAYEHTSYSAAEIRSFYDPFPCRADRSKSLDLQECVNLVSPIIADCAAKCQEDPNWLSNDDDYNALLEEKIFSQLYHQQSSNANAARGSAASFSRNRSRHTPPYSVVRTFFKGTPPARIPAILNLIRLGCYLSELGRGESVKSGILSLMILVDALGPSCGGVFPALPSEAVWAQHQRLCLFDAEQTLRQRIETQERDVLGTMQISYQSGLDAIRRLLYDSGTPGAQALVPPPGRWGVDEQVLQSGKEYLPSAWTHSRQDHLHAMQALDGGYEESMLSVRSGSTAFTATPTTRIGKSLSNALLYGKEATGASSRGVMKGGSHVGGGGGGVMLSGVQIEEALAFSHPSNRPKYNSPSSHHRKPVNFNQLPSTVSFMNNECYYPFEYILSCGSRAVFDISSEACKKYEMYHGQRFKYTKGDLSGSIVTIIGVCGGRLWRYTADTEAAPFTGRNAAEIVLLHGLEFVGGSSGGSLSQAQAKGEGVGSIKTPFSANLSPMNSPIAISLEMAAVAPSFSNNNYQCGSHDDAPTIMMPVPVTTSVRTADTFMYHTTHGHVVAFNVADEAVHGEFGVRFGDRFAVRDTLALRTICNVNIVPRKRTTTSSSTNPKITLVSGSNAAITNVSQEPYSDIPFGRITIIGIREGRLWFETCSSGAQPFLGNSGSLRLELNLQYLYSGAVTSTFANMARGSHIRICHLSKVGRVAVDTSPGAIAQFSPDIRSGTAVTIAKGALVGLRTIIVGVRHGRLLHQPHGTGQCTPFEYPYSTLMRHVRFTVYRGVHDVESLEDVVLREPVGITRQKCFKYLSLSGDVYSFDTTDSACGHVYGFGHGDRLQLTKPTKQAGRLVVVLGVRHGHIWCIDESDGSAFVLHGCVDHQSVVATFAPIVCGRSSIKEFTG